MMKLARPLLAATALTAAAILPATAADISYDPPVIDYEPPVMAAPQNDAFGGWYIRGDIGGRWSRMSGVRYDTYDVDAGGNLTIGSKNFDFAKLKGSFAVGGGVGYQISHYLRTDVTADYWFKGNFRGQTTDATTTPATISTDTSSFRALLLLANAYAELGTYKRITPYIGAGIGGAHIKWGDLNNRYPGVDDWHKGASGWRFAWALMAGASYCVTNNLHADLGYRFSRIEGGKMFSYGGGGNGAGPGFHKDINTHEVRAGLRYQFGNNGNRCGEEQIVYIPPEPYEPPVYK